HTEKTTAYVTLKSSVELELITKSIYDIISKNKSKEMVLTKLKQELEKMFEDFSCKTFGFTKFSNFVASIKNLTVIKNTVKLN
ncbi:MAG: hypothetical protein IH571_02665, partial [Acholeplasmataceae bacterium]|nr:hypothetical protein [Acholeplasmataceae bacterium]